MHLPLQNISLHSPHNYAQRFITVCNCVNMIKSLIHCIDQYNEGSTDDITDHYHDPIAPLTVRQTATLALLFGVVVSVAFTYQTLSDNVIKLVGSI